MIWQTRRNFQYKPEAARSRRRTTANRIGPRVPNFRAIARAEGRALNALAAEIDAARSPDTGLASAIRVHVLRHLQRDG
jgi:hypothetical protein